MQALTATPRPKAAETVRVRKIERRLRARLARMFPEIDVKPIVIELRPLIHAAARDGLEDHAATWRRMAAAPLFGEIVAKLTAALADKA